MSAAPSSEPVPIKPAFVSPWLTATLTAIGLAAAIYAANATTGPSLPPLAQAFLFAWLGLSVAATLIVTHWNFPAGFLIGLLAMLVGWRIGALLDVTLITYALLPAFAAFVVQFLDAARADLRRGPEAAMTCAGWHLTFVRIYIGFDMVPHFTEKLFAGPGPFTEDVKAFTELGMPSPEFFVTLGGLCELGIAIGIGLGLLTRLAALCATLYFLIATLAGGHFGLGFIWASPGGGWEYPVLMMVLYVSFAIWGAGKFSLDHVLSAKGLLPRPLKVLAAPT